VQRVPAGEFWLLAAATLLFNCGISVFFFLYNLYLLDTGLGESAMGWLTSAMVIGSMVGTLPMGWLASRYGNQRVLSISLLLMGVAFASRVCLPGMVLQSGVAFLSGVLLCGWMVCLSPALAAVVPAGKRSTAFSMLYAFAIAAGSAGAVIGGSLPQHCQSLFSALALSSGSAKRIMILVGCTFISLAAWPITKLSGQGTTNCVQWTHRPSPYLVRLLLAGACWSAAVGAFNPFAGVYLTRCLAFSLPRLGVFFSIAQVVQAVAVLLFAPWIMRRLGTMSAILAMQLATGIAMLGMALERGTLPIETLYCAFMIAQQMSQPGMQVLLMDHSPKDARSQMAAMNYLGVALAQAAAAAMAGHALEHFSYPTVLVGVAAAILLAALSFRALCSTAPQVDREDMPLESSCS